VSETAAGELGNFLRSISVEGVFPRRDGGHPLIDSPTVGLGRSRVIRFIKLSHEPHDAKPPQLLVFAPGPA